MASAARRAEISSPLSPMKADDPARGKMEEGYARGDTVDTLDTSASGLLAVDQRGEPGPSGGGADSDSEGGDSYQMFLSFLRSKDAKDAAGGDGVEVLWGAERKDAKDAWGGDATAEAGRGGGGKGDHERPGLERGEGQEAPAKMSRANGRVKSRRPARARKPGVSQSFTMGETGSGGGIHGSLHVEEETPGLKRGEEGKAIMKDQGWNAIAAWDSSPMEDWTTTATWESSNMRGLMVLNLDPDEPETNEKQMFCPKRYLREKHAEWQEERRLREEARADFNKSVLSSLGEVSSLDDMWRRGNNGFLYAGLPPDSHNYWRNKDQEQKIIWRHAARNRTLSDEDLLRRQIQLGEEARSELEDVRKEAERKEQEAAAALKQERISAAARLEEACRQAEEQAIRLERIRVHEEKQREWAELNRDYPIPDYLKDYVTGVFSDVDEDANADRFFNIGITGGTGTGKSSLISKIMTNFGANPGKMPHISFEADGTTEPTPYVLPGLNERVRLWDLPGQGTERFPSKSYLRDMGLKYFDALLLATDGRWKSDDSMLVDAIRFAGIWFRVVRTKVDLAVESGHYDHGISQEEALAQARATLQKQLINVTNPDMIHLVTSRSRFWADHGDAPFGLISTLCDELSGLLEDRG